MTSAKGDRQKNRRRNALAKKMRERKIFHEKSIPSRRKEYKRKFSVKDFDVAMEDD